MRGCQITKTSSPTERCSGIQAAWVLSHSHSLSLFSRSLSLSLPLALSPSLSLSPSSFLSLSPSSSLSLSPFPSLTSPVNRQRCNGSLFTPHSSPWLFVVITLITTPGDSPRSSLVHRVQDLDPPRYLQNQVLRHAPSDTYLGRFFPSLHISSGSTDSCLDESAQPGPSDSNPRRALRTGGITSSVRLPLHSSFAPDPSGFRSE